MQPTKRSAVIRKQPAVVVSSSAASSAPAVSGAGQTLTIASQSVAFIRRSPVHLNPTLVPPNGVVTRDPVYVGFAPGISHDSFTVDFYHSDTVNRFSTPLSDSLDMARGVLQFMLPAVVWNYGGMLQSGNENMVNLRIYEGVAAGCFARLGDAQTEFDVVVSVHSPDKSRVVCQHRFLNCRVGSLYHESYVGSEHISGAEVALSDRYGFSNAYAYPPTCQDPDRGAILTWLYNMLSTLTITKWRTRTVDHTKPIVCRLVLFFNNREVYYS